MSQFIDPSLFNNFNNFKTMPQNTGLVGENKVNEQKPFSPRHHSHFPLTQLTAGTMQFGMIQPHWVFEGVASDKNVTVRSSHDVRSYTLKAPLMQDLRIVKSYFKVYNDAILPLNWDKILTNPTIGDDVDASKVNAVIPDFNQILIKFSMFGQNLPSRECIGHNTWADCPLAIATKIMILWEYFLSAGSLLTMMDCHYQHTFQTTSKLWTNDKTFDDLFDYFCTFFFTSDPTLEFEVTFPNSGKVFRCRPGQETPNFNYSPGVGYVDFEYFLEEIRDDFDWYFSDFHSMNQTSIDAQSILKNNFTSVLTIIPKLTTLSPLNFSRFVAYQLVCAHYFSNDRVDYIYSANLCRQNFFDAWQNAMTTFGQSSVQPTFTYNGQQYQYDYFSGEVVYRLLDMMADWQNYLPAGSDWFDNTYISAVGNCVRLLFGKNRSLRYLDYFTGSKPQPLAVGNVNAPVVGGNVSAIDITRSIQQQRFFNAVMRSGRKMSSYLKDIFGSGSMPDYHDPQFLASVSDKIFASEVENTAAAQVDANARNTVTSTIRGNSDRYAFEIEVDRPCVLLGLTTFDITRYYCHNIERQYFHIDRFDMFNPFMQTIGDQVVYKNELDALMAHNAAFSYQLRHMEYKQPINFAYGGVLIESTDLDNWFFLADYKIPFDYTANIGPDYIRSRPLELDRFYSSLVGWSNGTRFHFIIHNRNDVSADRPMIKSPGIL